VPFLLAERARSECAHSMRAVKGGLGHSLNRGLRNWKALARAKGTSRRASGWAGRESCAQWGAHPSHPRDKVHEQAWKDHRWLLAAALLDRLFEHPAKCVPVVQEGHTI
jgi:hypothetical protein